jgi:sugar O-acyltransferase (sialic acid O-acetyltransferase NeuD family)
MSPPRPVALVGAGGHAKVVADALQRLGIAIGFVVDGEAAAWIEARRLASDDAALARLDPETTPVVLGLGGIEPAALDRRLKLATRYAAAGFALPAVIHPAAVVSAAARLADGAFVGPGAVVNAGARIGLAAIVNSAAIVEHDALIGDGAHVAPRAAVLGGAHVGVAAMIGAGAVVLPGAGVPDRALVPALSLHRPAPRAAGKEVRR